MVAWLQLENQTDDAAELEEKLRVSAKEVEDIREGRARDAQELLVNAKERLSILHNEVSRIAPFL